MVATYTADLYAGPANLITALEAIASNVPIQVIPFNQDGMAKFIVIKGAASPS